MGCLYLPYELCSWTLQPGFLTLSEVTQLNKEL